MRLSLLITLIQRWAARTTQNEKRALGVVAAMVVAVATGLLMLQPPELADLSEENRHQIPNLKVQWARGDLVVLVRHLERCDKEDFPCWEGSDGITSRSVAVGQELGKDFYQLGLGNSDIYNSPLSRTAQTEEIVFRDVGKDQEWLYRCRETMLADALKSKTPGRNLVLVTHSSCIAKFEHALGYDSDTPAYGTSLFFSATDKPGSLSVLGFLDAEDWFIALGF